MAGDANFNFVVEIEVSHQATAVFPSVPRLKLNFTDRLGERGVGVAETALRRAGLSSCCSIRDGGGEDEGRREILQGAGT